MIGPGAGVTVMGSGFEPFEGVAISLLIDSESKSIFAAADSNASGAFDVTNSPGGVAAGVYTIEAVGEFGSRASAPIAILEAAPPPTSGPGVYLQVGGGATYPVGATGIDVLGAGFKPNEGVLVKLINATVINPMERGDFPLIGGEANASGAFMLTTSRALPDTVQAGMYTALAIGDQGSMASAYISIVEVKEAGS